MVVPKKPKIPLPPIPPLFLDLDELRAIIYFIYIFN
jgi:hypothetical protein